VKTSPTKTSEGGAVPAGPKIDSSSNPAQSE